jgi:hypothetical protein
VQAWLEGLPVWSISIDSGGDAHGITFYRNPTFRLELEVDDSPSTRDRCEKAIRVALAGDIAQRRFSARSFRRHHPSQDWDHAIDLAMRMSGSTEQMNARLKLHTIEVVDRLEVAWPLVTRIAEALIHRRKLARRQIMALFTK